MLRQWCLARIVYSWFNNILLKPLTSQCLRTFQRSLWLAFFFGVLGLLFVLFWSCLSLFKFYISWIKAQGIHVTYPWVTVLCVNHKPTNHIFSVQCLFLLFISFLVCLTSSFYLLCLRIQPIFSSKLPLTLFPQRLSVPSQHSPPVSQDFLAVWSIFCICTLDPGGEMCWC